MKEYKKYYDELIKMPAFAHINNEKDMDWLMSCLEGRIVDCKGEGELWIEGEFIYANIPGTSKALRMKKKIAEKLCSFKCDFHQALIEYLLKWEKISKNS